jgi:hypothetical protein
MGKNQGGEAVSGEYWQVAVIEETAYHIIPACASFPLYGFYQCCKPCSYCAISA